jgi:hypothetical protein
MNRPLMRVCAGLATLAVGATAHAELLYEFTFHATVTEKWGDNPDHPWGGVEVGDPAFFQYVIDVEQEDQSGGSSLSFYDLESVVISHGGIDAVPQRFSRMRVDLLGGGGSDLVEIVARQVWTDSLLEGGVFELRGFNVLPDDSIPIDFDVLDFSIVRSITYGDSESLLLKAQFDSYSYQIIPAPGAAFGLALGVMFRGGRRRRC